MKRSCLWEDNWIRWTVSITWSCIFLCIFQRSFRLFLLLGLRWFIWNLLGNSRSSYTSYTQAFAIFSFPQGLYKLSIAVSWFRVTQFSPNSYIISQHRGNIYLLSNTFNVYSALSQECHDIAWKVSNLLLYKVIYCSPSKSCKSHPLSRRAHLSAVVQVLQLEEKSLYLLPVCQQTALIMYLP